MANNPPPSPNARCAKLATDMLVWSGGDGPWKLQATSLHHGPSGQITHGPAPRWHGLLGGAVDNHGAPSIDLGHVTRDCFRSFEAKPSIFEVAALA